MHATTEIPVASLRTQIWARLELILFHVCILGICAVLIGAFVIQFGYKEMPCPLCLIQRMCMILAALGPAYVLVEGRSRHAHGLSIMGSGFGMSILAAVGGMAVSARQVLLHIAPGDPGYGAPVMGMHLYTWALVVFVAVIVVSGLTIMFQPTLELPRSQRMRWLTRLTLGLFALVIAANAVSALLEAGPNLYLPDNPERYLGL
jgi:disulfide bond formation protein DsbB